MNVRAGLFLLVIHDCKTQSRCLTL